MLSLISIFVKNSTFDLQLKACKKNQLVAYPFTPPMAAKWKKRGECPILKDMDLIMHLGRRCI
jgi:hypothetical protein